MSGTERRTQWWDRYLILSPLVGLLLAGYTALLVHELAPLARRGVLWHAGVRSEMALPVTVTFWFILLVLAVCLCRWRLQRSLRYYDAMLAGIMFLAYDRMAGTVQLFINRDLLTTPLLRIAGTETASLASLLGMGVLCVGVFAQTFSLTQARQESLTLQALGDLARPLNNFDLKEALLPSLARLAEATGADACFIYLAEREGGLSCFCASPTEATGRPLPGRALVSWSVSHAEPLISGDLATDPRGGQPEVVGRRRALLVVPLQGEAEIIGAVALTRRNGRFITPDLDLVRTFASRLAVVIENGRLFSEARQLSITDDGTGLFNLRHFHECLEREMRASRTTGRPLSLVMIDSDSLKQVNDQLGHLAGDLLIRHLGQTIRKAIRNGDLVFRYAGDEFMVLLPGTELAIASEVAERIRLSVQHEVVHYDNISFRGTVSLGVATFPEHGDNADTMIRAVDQALYRSKHNGKNCVTYASPA